MKMIANIRRLPIKSSNIYFQRNISKLEAKKLRKEKKRQERLENQRRNLEKKEAQEKIDESFYGQNLKPGDKKITTLGLPKKYNSKFVESSWYDWWEKEGFFSPKAKVRSVENFSRIGIHLS